MIVCGNFCDCLWQFLWLFVAISVIVCGNFCDCLWPTTSAWSNQLCPLARICVNVLTDSIWLNSDLYLCYRIEDLITPHYWSCSSELYMNFVFASCFLTNQIAYLWTLYLHHDFDQSDSVFYTECSNFEDDESRFVVTFSCSLLRSKSQRFRITVPSVT